MFVYLYNNESTMAILTYHVFKRYEKRSGFPVNRMKSSWHLKLLLSSSLAIGSMVVVPFDLSPIGFKSSRVEAATAYKTTANLNLRSRATTQSAILSTIPSGSNINYISSHGSWYKVSYGGKTGYVASQYVKKTSTATTTNASTYYKTTANLNLRVSAATWSKILVTIPSGASVKYISRYGSWYKVSYGSKVGYVASQYLKRASTPTTSTGSGRTIVIDAGHGGNDPGAVYGSSYEKVIALDIATRLASALSNTYGYHTRLTRTNDSYVSLARRVELTKSYKASAFISIHSNSSINTSYHGHEVLVPTSSSYTTNPYITASRNLGTAINRELGARIPTIRNRGVINQNVYVVGKNTVPATLVEYGFISNANDRSHLTSSTYRQQMANATASGIHQFMSTSN